jgi:hypothetical protein
MSVLEILSYDISMKNLLLKFLKVGKLNNMLN